MAGKSTIALVENSYLIRSGMENLVKELPGVYLADIFDGTENHLHDKINRMKPDMVMINPSALNNRLFSLLQALDDKIILIGLIDDHVPPAIRSKFSYIIHINAGKFELLDILNKIPGIQTKKPEDSQINQSLSEREITVLKHITQGMTNQEIAEKLFLSVHTVTTHRKNITKKLGIKTVSGLTVYALLNKVIDMREINQ